MIIITTPSCYNGYGLGFKFDCANLPLLTTLSNKQLSTKQPQQAPVTINNYQQQPSTTTSPSTKQKFERTTNKENSMSTLNVQMRTTLVHSVRNMPTIR